MNPWRGASGSVAAVAVAALLATGAWIWQRQAAPRGLPLPIEIGQAARVQEAYPLVADSVKLPMIKTELLEQVVLANPFSMQRRAKPPALEAGPGSGSDRAATKAPVAQFIYKGRIELGSRLRAILQEAPSGKTHFLEVGQEVAGFKILDISESQVLLSNLQTREDITVALNAPARP
jgi:hypothetical protein